MAKVAPDQRLVINVTTHPDDGEVKLIQTSEVTIKCDPQALNFGYEPEDTRKLRFALKMLHRLLVATHREEWQEGQTLEAAQDDAYFLLHGAKQEDFPELDILLPGQEGFTPK